MKKGMKLLEIALGFLPLAKPWWVYSLYSQDRKLKQKSRSKDRIYLTLLKNGLCFLLITCISFNSEKRD
jgi:hypothetical protein